MRFINEFDKMADKACEAIKMTGRRYVAQGAISNSDEISDLKEAKAALCAAMSSEIDQWRFRGVVTKMEENLRHF